MHCLICSCNLMNTLSFCSYLCMYCTSASFRTALSRRKYDLKHVNQASFLCSNCCPTLRVEHTKHQGNHGALVRSICLRTMIRFLHGAWVGVAKLWVCGTFGSFWKWKETTKIHLKTTNIDTTGERNMPKLNKFHNARESNLSLFVSLFIDSAYK
jgi:hypothetical protein